MGEDDGVKGEEKADFETKSMSKAAENGSRTFYSTSINERMTISRPDPLKETLYSYHKQYQPSPSEPEAVRLNVAHNQSSGDAPESDCSEENPESDFETSNTPKMSENASRSFNPESANERMPISRPDPLKETLYSYHKQYQPISSESEAERPNIAHNQSSADAHESDRSEENLKSDFETRNMPKMAENGSRSFNPEYAEEIMTILRLDPLKETLYISHEHYQPVPSESEAERPDIAHNKSSEDSPVSKKPSAKPTNSPGPGNKDDDVMMERQAYIYEIAPYLESVEALAEMPDPETEQMAILAGPEKFNERKDPSSAKFSASEKDHDISKASVVASFEQSERKKESLAQENVTFKDNHDKTLSQIITGKVKKSITLGNLEIIEDRHKEVLRRHSLQDRRSSTKTPAGSNNSAPLRDGRENRQYSPKEQEPRIQVSIGRIEVKATASPPPKKQSRSASPLLSLDEYLRQRAGGNGR
jgi:hypothetical protein